MGAFVVFAIATPRGLPNGDAAVYAQQVLAHDFASRPVHLGYYLLASVGTLAGPLPDRYFNLLSAALAAGALELLWWLGRRYFPERPGLALLPPLALLGNVFFFENAVQAEVYAAQTFFVALALWLWHRAGGAGGGLLAGLAFGAAGLVSPSSALFAPIFLVIRRPRAGPLGAFAAGAAAMMLPIVPVAHEYFYGDRGLLAAAGKGLGPARIVAKEALELGLGFLTLAPWLALGAWRVVKTPALRPLGAALAAGWATVLVLGERFGDVPAQLPTWTLAALLVAAGAAELEARLAGSRSWWLVACLATAAPLLGLLFLLGRSGAVRGLEAWILLPALAALAVAAAAGWRKLAAGERRQAVGFLAVAAVLANFLVAVTLIREKNREIDGYRAEALALGAVAAPDFLAIGSWERGILLEHYLFRRSYTEHFLNTAWLAGAWGAERQAAAEATLATAVAAGRQVWLLGPTELAETRLRDAGYRLGAGAGSLRRAERPAVPGE